MFKLQQAVTSSRIQQYLVEKPNTEDVRTKRKKKKKVIIESNICTILFFILSHDYFTLFLSPIPRTKSCI